MRGDRLEELMVTIPSGIRSGARLRLQGKEIEDGAGNRWRPLPPRDGHVTQKGCTSFA